MIKIVISFTFLFVYVASQYKSLPEGSPCSWLGLNGTCALIHRCYSAETNIDEKKIPPICGYEGKDPIICCTDCDLVEDSRNIIFDTYLGFLYKNGKKAHDQCLEYIHHSYYPCKGYKEQVVKWELDSKRNCNVPMIRKKEGTSFSAGGVGGRDAERNEYPHMALLGYGDDFLTAQWLCGGSVISHNFILTAAHCISSSTYGKVAFAGLEILMRSDPPMLWKKYRIKTIIPHPEYKPPSKYHDIALLETGTPIIFSYQLRPACLHYDDEVDENAHATGWSALGRGKPLADILQSVPLQKYTTEECKQLYPPHRTMRGGYDPTTQMCYGDRKEIKDTCQGDSGGPLQAQNEVHTSDCVYTILGVTSTGTQCDVAAGNAGVYTRVSHYVPWIESIVWP